MQMFYSASTNGFYAERINKVMPPDAVPVNEATYRQFAGQQVAPGPDGQPTIPTQNTPAPPAVVTMRQARLALLSMGLLAAVDPVIAALPSPQREAAQIEWEFAATVERDSDLLTGVSQAIGLTAAQLDQLFTLAATL